MNIHCKYDTLAKVSDLKPHPKNRNKHPGEQIDRLAEIIAYQGIRAPIVVSKRSGCIVKGHGTLEAIKRNELDTAPVVYQDFDSDEQEYAFVQSDNAIASWAELDLSGINTDIGDLGPDFNIDLLGIQDFSLDLSDKDFDSNGQEYSAKVESPIYTPKGDKPEIGSLADISKTETLVKEIDSADLPAEIKDFLKIAAQRHTVFNYESIAEFYAHNPKEVQDLMEKSALVIIDFKKAIENGFVVLSAELASSYAG